MPGRGREEGSQFSFLRQAMMLFLPVTGLVAHAALHHPSTTHARFHRPLPLAAIRVSPRAPHGALMSDGTSSCRELGIPEDSSYNEIMEAFMRLSKTYLADPARVGLLAAAKDKVGWHVGWDVEWLRGGQSRDYGDIWVEWAVSKQPHGSAGSHLGISSQPRPFSGSYARGWTERRAPRTNQLRG